MRFDIMTLFPDTVKTVLGESILGRAQKSGALTVNVYNFRDYSGDKRHRVDDTPCGGGMGMLLQPQPIYSCFKDITADKKEDEKIRTVYMSPRGTVLTQEVAKRLSSYDRIVILCGHYEGVDQRLLDEIADEEISIGDFVLTGGEIPACVLADSVGRLCPGVLSDSECHEIESFENNLLEFPQYTRPVEWMGRKVPDVLLSGHHANIDKWRLEQSIELTRRRRPDLYEKYIAEKDNRKKP